MEINNGNKHTTAFKGLRENIIIGEQALKDFRKNYKQLVSPTFLNLRLEKYKDIDSFSTIIPKIQAISHQNAKHIGTIRVKYFYKNYKTYEMFITQLKNVVKLYKVANCKEQAFLLQHDLIKKGVDANKVSFWIEDKITQKTKTEAEGHSFVVIGMNKNADINNPLSWGKPDKNGPYLKDEAVVVCPWSGEGRAKRARIAIEDMKKLFNFNPETDTIRYEITNCPDFAALAAESKKKEKLSTKIKNGILKLFKGLKK